MHITKGIEMKSDKQVIKQVALTLKFLAKDLRNGEVNAGKVSTVCGQQLRRNRTHGKR
jgi:hypothetical protein